MNESVQHAEPVLVSYQENKQLKTITQEQAIALVNQIAQRDSERALHFQHRLCAENPYAEKLAWSFYQNLSDLFLFEQLLDVCNQRLLNDSNHAVSIIWKVESLVKMYRHNDAVNLMEKIVAGNPQDHLSLSRLGLLHKRMGNTDKALWCFNRAIEQNHYFASPYWYRSDICDAPEENLAALHALIASDNSPQDQQHFLHFAAYRYAERLGNHEEAFQHLQLANAYARGTFDYDIEQVVAEDQAYANLFSAEFLAEFSSDFMSDIEPIFLVGMPASGVSKLEHILSRHSQIASGGESGALANALAKAQIMAKSSSTMLDWLAERHQTDWEWIARAYLSNIRFAHSNKQIVTDMSVSNPRLIGIIRLVLPEAKIIWLKRDAKDSYFASYRELFDRGHALHSYQFDEIMKKHQSQEALMAHWQDLAPDSIHQINFEDLVNNGPQSISSLLNFCGLNNEDACLEIAKTSNWVDTSSYVQSAREPRSEDIGQWKNYSAQLEPFFASMSQEPK